MNSLILLGFNLFLIDITKIKNLIINIIVMFVAIIIYMLGLYVYQVSNPVIYKDLDSMYSRIQVYKGIAEDNRELKYIKVGIVGSESLKYEDNEINAYLKYFDLPKYYYKNYNRCLLVGGAGYTYPTEFFSKEENQNVKMDVVEIDPVMTQIAIDDFDLDLSNQNLNNYNQDARSFIKRTDEKYDAIFLDAFKGDQIPYELTTIQFMYEMKEKLKDNGVVISNIISILKGDGNNFFAYEYATFKKAFDDVIIYRIDNSMDPDERQNMILIGVKGHFDLNDTYKYIEEDLQNNLVLDYTSDKTVITDDLFQIEN
jgi:spermidine synthase